MINSSYESIIREEVFTSIFEGKEEDDVKQIIEDSLVLTFSTDNAKLGPDVATFSLPAGWSCPFAKDCKMLVNRDRSID